MPQVIEDVTKVACAYEKAANKRRTAEVHHKLKDTAVNSLWCVGLYDLEMRKSAKGRLDRDRMSDDRNLEREIEDIYSSGAFRMGSSTARQAYL